MKILLLGAGGQLGRALAPALMRRDEVAAPPRSALDLADASAVRRAVREVAPDIIVNAAGYTAVDQAESEADAAMAANARGPEALAQAAAEAGAALVHYSTEYVFDGEQDVAYREDDPPRPLNQYGRSKLAGEQAIAAAGAPHLILRTTWLYGAAGRNFLNTMLRLGGEREVLTVVDDQVGAPTSVGVVVDATLRILAQAAADPAEFFRRQGGIVHLACHGATSWHGFTEAIFDEARRAGLPLKVREVRPVPTEAFPTPARRPRNSRLDLGRLEKRFDVIPPDWRAALKDVFREIRR